MRFPTYVSFLFLCLTSSSFGQLPWMVKPIIDYDRFDYSPEYNTRYVIVGKGEKEYGVMDLTGKYLYPVGTFTMVSNIPGNGLMYGVTPEGKTIAWNSLGKNISDGFDELNAYHHTNIVLAKKGGLYGLIDTLGNQIKPAIYKNISRVERGLYKCTLPDGSMEMFEVAESDGLYPALRRTNERSASSRLKDRIIVRSPSPKKGTDYFGFLNTHGDTILRADRYYSYYDKMKYDQGLMIAIDGTTEKEGVFNTDGKIVVPFEYDKVYKDLVSSTFLLAKKGTTHYLLKPDGTVLAKTEATQLFEFGNEPFLKATIAEKKTILDINLQPVIPADLDQISDWQSSRAVTLSRIKLNGFYSFKTGLYTEPQFKKVSLGNSNIAAVMKKDRFAFYNVHTGQYLTEDKFTGAAKGNQYYIGYIETTDSIFQGGIQMTNKITTSVVLDSVGKVIYGPVPNKISFISGDIYSEKIGKDTLILHDFAHDITSGVFSPKIQTQEDNVTKLGQNQYAFTTDLVKPGYQVYEFLDATKENVRVFRLNGKYGILHDRTQVTKPEYDEVKEIRDGMIEVKYNGKWGILKNPFSKN